MVISVGWLSSPSYAENNFIFPDSAQLNFNVQVIGDTIIISIDNLSSQPVEKFFLSDFTGTPANLLECRVDNTVVDSVVTETLYGSIYSDKYTTRWVIGTFSNNLQLKYYPYSGNISFSGAHPFPFFGVMPGIGPPVNLKWTQ